MKQTDFFGSIGDDFGCALADDALVSIAVIDGFFGAYEGVTIVEFKGYAGILAQHVDFAPLVGRVKEKTVALRDFLETKI